MVRVRCQNPKAKWRNGAPCGHGWDYHGALKSRIKCPKCGSRRNSVNWEKFGHWAPPKDAPRSGKQDAKKT